ncbi:MAG: hypothetical protein EBX76_03765, partial [Acidimicrobiia bacterium]|nr:hypothetical protein [Acidimicrobiia bacterium]
MLGGLPTLVVQHATTRDGRKQPEIADPPTTGSASLQGCESLIDYGALRPRIPEVLRTPSGKVELAPPELLADLPRLRASLAADPDALLLVGRRHLRSNNSWMHNIRVLVKGKPRCTLQMHPLDAARLGVTDGAPVRVTSRVGSVVAPVEITDDIRERVVSLPHGFGH